MKLSPKMRDRLLDIMHALNDWRVCGCIALLDIAFTALFLWWGYMWLVAVSGFFAGCDIFKTYRRYFNL